MAETVENNNSINKPDNSFLFLQKIMYFFVLLFCFILFPAFFIHNSLTIYFSNNAETLKQEKLEDMNKILEYMEKYSSNKKYFHYLLSDISGFAKKSSDPLLYMKKSIENLKNKYPDKFEFVVWDKDGKIVRELTDKNGYGYILGKLYSTLSEVKIAVNNDVTVKISDLASVKKNINLIRNFLGKIFVAENLKYPIIKGHDAGPIQTELGNGLSFCWYSVGEKLSFLCFLSEPMIKDYSGLNKICNSLNSKGSDIITGYCMTPDYTKPITDFPAAYRNSLGLACSIFENAGDSIFENDRAIIRMAMPQPNLRTFCYFSKKDEIWDYEYKSNLWFGIFGSILLVIYCLFGYWFLYKKHFFSIRWKLTALFLFANLVPIGIVGFIAKGYVENKRLAIRNEIIGDLEKELREFDAGYKSLMEDYATRINERVEVVAQKVGNGIIRQPEIDELKRIYKDFNGCELLIVASDSRMVDFCRDENKSTQKIDFMAKIAAGMLSYVNNSFKRSAGGAKDVFDNILNPEVSGVVRVGVKHSKKVGELTFGEFIKVFYIYLFGDNKNYKNNYIFTLSWDRGVFQNIFLKESFKTINKNFPEAEFFIKSKDGKITFGTHDLNDKLLAIFEKNSGMTEKITGSVYFNNHENIFVCLNAANMFGLTTLALYPDKRINKEINIIIIQIIAGTLISLLLTIIIGHILLQQFLKPIHNLGEAALAIDARDFTYRVPIGDKDEFGHLNQVFNRAIEGLGDFEVARIIQEGLFPGNNFNAGDCNIYGKSIVKTTLGGDYYDCFKINDEYQGIIIGDVAGSGIPAGLMMAMAKSGVLSSSDDIKLNPSALADKLHKIFSAIKSNKLKRMMTLTYYVLRVSDGHLIYTNAGHNFPILVDSIKKTARFIDYVAIPLGIGIRCRCINQELNLEKGQSLVLYTSGFVEADNEAGEQFGYERLKKALIEQYNPDSEVYYNNLYENVYKKWTPDTDDDLTLVIVNRN